MKRMLINGCEEGECRVAVMSNDRLDDIFVERASQKQCLGNIYQGRIANIERGIQSAFVDIGMPVHGFLHVNDAIFPHVIDLEKGRRPAGPAAPEKSDLDGFSRNGQDSDPLPPHPDNSGAAAPPPSRGLPNVRIEDVLAPGRWVTVQVIKEQSGNKGPALTTNISLAGRYIVLMPHWGRNGLSRKIGDDGERARLKEMLSDVKFPEGMGGIIRTAGLEMKKSDFQKDLAYLLRLWEVVRRRAAEQQSPALIYQESELAIRVLRDGLNPEIDEIVVDSRDLFKKARDFMGIVAPRQKDIVKLHEGADPLFHHYGVEREIERIFDHRVEMPSGGSIVIEQTEALAAIDVNSGRYRKGGSVEETALAINSEAAAEIARQIRLRDLGGMIVIDFIDMKDMKNRKAVEKEFRKAMAFDKARTRILRMSEFCLLQLTRRRQKHSLRIAHFDPCAACAGTGYVLSDESLALGILREVRHAVQRKDARRVVVETGTGAARLLLNDKRAEIAELEQKHGRKIFIQAAQAPARGAKQVRVYNQDGREIAQ